MHGASNVADEKLQSIRIGDSSFDKTSNSITGMLDFHHKPNTTPVILDPKTGAITAR